ncbi:hypothetical protein C7433_10142 [Pantoea sp. PNA 03-3]|nr:hypothetical protein C7433_10142 [Pantoea sp. PNA 03-3]
MTSGIFNISEDVSVKRAALNAVCCGAFLSHDAFSVAGNRASGGHPVGNV